MSAAIPLWKKRLLEAVQAKRGDRFLSATVEYGVDKVLREHGLLTDDTADAA